MQSDIDIPLESEQTSPPDIERLLDADEVAAVLGVSRKWVYQAAIDGKIPAYRFASFVKFRESEIKKWIRAQATGSRR